MKRWILLIVAVVLFAGAASGSWLVLKSRDAGLGAIVSRIEGFKPYYFDGAPPDGFTLVKESVKFESDVLVFTMKNEKSGKTLVFTEQRTPDDFDIGSLRGDKEFKTQYGQAFVTDGQTRTTGTLFTDDRTWILINAPEPIGGDTMQGILNALQASSK